MVKVTEKAAEKLKEMTANQDSPNKMLRVSFGGFGWGGPKLHLALDELSHDTDIVVESQGVKIVYDANIENYIANTVIDYSANYFTRGFYVRGGSFC